MPETINSLLQEYLLEQERARLDRDINGDYTKNGLRHLIKSAQIQLTLSNMTEGEISEKHKATAENIIQNTFNKMQKLGMIRELEPEQSVPVPEKTQKIEHILSEKTGAPEEDTGDPRAELNELIGLASVKEKIGKILNKISVDVLREENNLPIKTTSLHMIFKGNPGTGKTTVARLVARIYKQMGVLPKGHLVEVHAHDLVSKYINETGENTQKVIDEAMGGVLFIDEAYALYKPGDDKDHGKEAINTLLTGMENHNGEFAVIAAGYPADMKVFLTADPGLPRRFMDEVEFEDYSPEELLQIFKLMSSKYKDTLSPDAEETLKNVLTEKSKDPSFGNAGGVRNLYDLATFERSDRIMALKNSGTDITNAILTTFEKEDILAAANWKKEE